ncbi:site-specific DNA-methyltransferase [Heliobacterium chlorum]|uniref:Methyltransferase n=1 Tax=Heliobacterium chlorum TaxID=2698 RepID=A0ABR7T7S8_HELCL|nr:site-specific DNA-methyltransferase [Heliobacterium chlorum]MBC9786405.1 site-specific DNA-methyltransferase [Heliobacterium chlorum]
MQFINQVLQGDSLEILKTLPDNSVDSCVTDPPYGLSKEPDIKEVLSKWLVGEDYVHRGSGFMGKTWDSFVPRPAIWREVFRVLKPGGHILCFAGTRTQDLMTVALRIAGFEIRDVIEWLYTSGFPKNLDVSKQFDKRAGSVREKIRIPYNPVMLINGQNTRPWMEKAMKQGFHEVDSDEPVSELAKKWDGWGSSIKPAHEPVIMGRKPLTGNICDTVERYGTGAINVDGCRIGEEGRYPANCITTEPSEWYSKFFNITPQELSKKSTKKDKNSDWKGNVIDLEERRVYPGSGRGVLNSTHTLDGRERKPVFNRNHHPTVKPTGLMAWLIRFVTAPEGIVLDPFGGSGTTGAAALQENRRFILIEREAEYVEIARARVG